MRKRINKREKNDKKDRDDKNTDLMFGEAANEGQEKPAFFGRYKLLCCLLLAGIYAAGCSFVWNGIAVLAYAEEVEAQKEPEPFSSVWGESIVYEEVQSAYEQGEDGYVEERDKAAADEILAGNPYSDDAARREKEEFLRDDWRLILINKQHPIPEDYNFNFGFIKTKNGNMRCDERIIPDLLQMLQGAKDVGINLEVCSPYRDENRQIFLFQEEIKEYMKQEMSYMDAYTLAAQSVNVPGSSEHQVGLALDIVCDQYSRLDRGFADSDAGRWLAAHSCEYGFILRYPEGKEYVTGIKYEPWHFRYVGVEAATIIMREELTLEEFVDSLEDWR